VSWTPNGIDMTQWALIESDKKNALSLRTKCLVGDNKIIVGIFGQLKVKKGVLFFLENCIHAGYSGMYHFLLIGDLDPALQEWLNLQSECTYTHLPFMDRFELLPYYAVCDYVAIPSYYDGMPNVLLEAASLGIPCIGSTAGGMGDILVDNVHGILFSPGDNHSCRHAIMRVTQLSNEQRQSMGEQSRVLVEQTYSLKNEINRYLLVFRATNKKMSQPDTL
jgi:glycogen synthase